MSGVIGAGEVSSDKETMLPTDGVVIADNELVGEMVNRVNTQFEFPYTIATVRYGGDTIIEDVGTGVLDSVLLAGMIYPIIGIALADVVNGCTLSCLRIVRVNGQVQEVDRVEVEDGAMTVGVDTIVLET
jgi:hypothetical protein